jgi:PleD family two-component response regulator
MELLRQRGLEHVRVLVGGIIPDVDIPKLKEMGVTGIFLPAARCSRSSISSTRTFSPGQRLSDMATTRSLLLADGSVTIQRVMELTFAHEDIRVTAVSDGRKAIQHLDTQPVDVVLADVDLPEVDGYSLAAHMRRVPRLKTVPVLLLAGAFEPVDQAKAREVGSDGVITKPFEPQVVVTRVKELIDQRDRQKTPPPGQGREG